MQSSSQRRTRMTGRERRAQLIQTARQLFAQRGFEGTSIEEIASRAGVSKPVVYEHFGGKEGIYAVVLDREWSMLVGAVEQSMQASDLRAQLKAMVGALLRFVDENPEGFRIISRSGELDALIDHLAGGFELALTGRNRSLARAHAQMIVGMAVQTARWWVDRRDPPREALVEAVYTMLWNGISDQVPQA